MNIREGEPGQEVGVGSARGGGGRAKGFAMINRVLACEYMCLCACADGCVPVRADKRKTSNPSLAVFKFLLML